MTWPKLVSVAAHAALLGWLILDSARPAPPRDPPPALDAELVEPIYTPPPPPPPPPRAIEPPKEIPKATPKPRRARVRPRVAAVVPQPADPIEPLPIPAALPAPPDAPIEPTDTFIEDPEPVHRPHPKYPESALRYRRKGVVELAFSISVDGRVRDVRVVRAEPEGVFDRAALEALEKWRYDPQRINGVAVERENVRVRLVFTPH